jgi:hypothetical protein
VRVLTYHVVPSVAAKAEDLSDGQELPTALEGQSLKVHGGWAARLQRGGRRGWQHVSRTSASLPGGTSPTRRLGRLALSSPCTSFSARLSAEAGAVHRPTSARLAPPPYTKSRPPPPPGLVSPTGEAGQAPRVPAHHQRAGGEGDRGGPGGRPLHHPCCGAGGRLLEWRQPSRGLRVLCCGWVGGCGVGGGGKEVYSARGSCSFAGRAHPPVAAQHACCPSHCCRCCCPVRRIIVPPPLPATARLPLPTTAAPPLPATARPPLPTTARPPLPTTAAPPLPATARPPLPTTARPPLPTTAPPPLPTTARPPLPTTAPPPLPTTAPPPPPTTARPPPPTTARPPLRITALAPTLL